MQICPCPLRCVHDWSSCPYAHQTERAKRRDPRVFAYTGIACLSMKQVWRLVSNHGMPTVCPWHLSGPLALKGVRQGADQ